MPVAKVTSKGQVTIPKQVREVLRIGAGDRVAFIIRADGVVELRPETVDLRQLFGVLEFDGEPVSVAKMNEDIADAATGRLDVEDPQ